MESDTLYTQTLHDLMEMERITEAKIQATLNRQPESLVGLLQDQLDPMCRLGLNTVELAGLSDPQRAEIGTHIVRWAQREQYLKDLLEKNLGYIGYLKHVLGITGPDMPNLNVGL